MFHVDLYLALSCRSSTHQWCLLAAVVCLPVYLHPILVWLVDIFHARISTSQTRHIRFSVECRAFAVDSSLQPIYDI